MVVRVASLQLPVERIDEVIERYREILRPVHLQLQGLRHHYWLVNRESGQVKIVGHWDSQAALDAAAPLLEPARVQFWNGLGVAPTLEVYEVADEI
jgi:hypothetical protein